MRAKLQQSLQVNLNEMFFTQRLILVEGLEDIAYIIAYLQLTDQWDEYRRLGCHMIATNGKDSIIQPLAIANAMGIPTIVVFDSDADKYGIIDLATDPEGKRAARRPMHLRDNTAILRLLRHHHNQTRSRRKHSSPAASLMWHSEIGSIVEEDIGADDWLRFKAAADQELGQPGGLQKNSMQIGLTLAKAWDAGKRSPHLEQLCQHLLNMAPPLAPATVRAPVPALAAPPPLQAIPPRPAPPN